MEPLPDPSAPATLKAVAILALLCLLPAAAVAEPLPLPPPGEGLVGANRLVRTLPRDTLVDLARRHGYGYTEVRLANPGIDPWLPGAASIILPGLHVLPDAPREGIVINIPEMRLYYYPAVDATAYPQVMTYPVGIGKAGWRTPEVRTVVVAKERNPVWRVPESIRRERAEQGETMPDTVSPGAGNPLGEFVLRLARPGYLIHGSNRKYGIGMRVSHGCIRLAADDIRQLFRQVPVGTPVHVVNQPYKVGVLAGQLYLEVHPPLPELGRPVGKTEVVAAIIRATDGVHYEADWEAAFRAVDQASGIPTVIGRLHPPARD
jgi:L,D-transpeptidase ErfK/SrfK